jgi:enoyl-CoA hydratase/carnithine racemase
VAVRLVKPDAHPALWRIVLDRAEKLNALNEDTRRELQATIDELAERPDIRVVVLEGEGRAFSAGADLAERSTAPADALVQRHATGAWQRLLDDLERLPQVTLARLQGHVIGGGFLLAAACDLRVASDDLSLSIPEIALGIPLTWAGLPRLAREIGLPRTRDVVMTGRRIGGAEALQWGLVHRLVTPDELDAAVDLLVSELLAKPAVPLAMTVDALRALGRATSGTDAAWSDPDLLRWSLQHRSD